MYILRWIIYVPSVPFSVIFAYTIPNSHYHREWYMVIGGFIMSIIWIGILSFITVILVGRSGCILGINHFTMGLVIVASGTSIPDALSSLLVARDGYGDMAISNAIGSNIFDLDLGLGLPFLVGIILNRFQPIQLYTYPDGCQTSPVPQQSADPNLSLSPEPQQSADTYPSSSPTRQELTLSQSPVPQQSADPNLSLSPVPSTIS